MGTQKKGERNEGMGEQKCEAGGRARKSKKAKRPSAGDDGWEGLNEKKRDG